MNAVESSAVDPDRIEYESREGTFYAIHDWARDDSISVSVIEAVGAATDDGPLDLEPLHEVIDPDELDRFVASLRADGCGRIRFTYNDCAVAVRASGLIEVRPPE